MHQPRVPVKYDWHDNHSLAKNLFDESSKKEYSPLKNAYLRASISRAYFAAFCLARNYLRDTEHLTIPKKDTHSWVINQFHGSSLQKQKIHEQLKRLRDDRNKADYNDIIRGLERITESVLIGVNVAIHDIDSL